VRPCRSRRGQSSTEAVISEDVVGIPAVDPNGALLRAVPSQVPMAGQFCLHEMIRLLIGIFITRVGTNS